MIVCCFILATAWQAPNVTYRAPAKTVPVLLKELSAQTKLNLKANDEASREVVIVSVKDVPLPTLMEKIAAATSCKWRQTADGYTLVPDEALRSKELNEALADRAEHVRNGIATVIKGSADAKQQAEVAAAKAKAQAEAKQKEDQQKSATGAQKQDVNGKSGGDDDESDDEAAGPSGASDYDVVQFLKLLEPTVLANLAPGDRVVWASNNATGAQRSLNGDAAAMVQQWIGDHNTETTEISPDEMQQIQKMVKEHPEMAAMMERSSPQKVTAPVYKVIVSAELGDTGFADNGITINVCAFDRSGKILLNGQTSFSLDSDRDPMVPPAPGELSPAKHDAGKKIVYSPNSQLLLELTEGAIKSNPFSPHIPKELWALLSHPDLTDPLSYTVSDGLMQYADDKGRQLVADVPDSTFGGLFTMGGADWKGLNDVQRSLDQKDEVTAADDGAFLVVRPSQPAIERMDRVDRNDLRKLFGIVETRRVLDLDSVSRFALSNPSPTTNGIEGMDGLFALPGLMPGLISGAVNWEMLRLYGSLEPTQRASLLSGTPIPFGRLSEIQRGYLEHVVFGAGADLLDRADQKPEGDDEGIFGMLAGGFGQGPREDYRHEPTELMPQGLPASGTLQCTAADAPVFFASTGDTTLLGFPFGAQEIALFDMMSQEGAGAGRLELPQSGYLGLRRTLKFTLNLSPAIIQKVSLPDVSIPDGAAQVSLTGLPSEFQAKVDKAKSAFQNSSVRFGGQGGGGTTPTPR